jgi:putative transposase
MRAIKNVRLKDYDYSSNGFYFITIITHLRQKLFEGQNKDVVARFIGRLGELPGVSVDYSVVMPDHVHMILALDGSHLRLGEIVRRFKAWITQDLKTRVWQPNYYEHVIRNEKALLKIREYIQNNPEAEKLKWEQFYSSAIN